MPEVQDDIAGPVFIILTESDKGGTLAPDVIGPFALLSEAKRFGAEHCREIEGMGFREPTDGGYAGVTYVAPGLVDYSPEQYVEEYPWDEDDEEEDQPA